MAASQCFLFTVTLNYSIGSGARHSLKCFNWELYHKKKKTFLFVRVKTCLFPSCGGGTFLSVVDVAAEQTLNSVCLEVCVCWLLISNTSLFFSPLLLSTRHVFECVWILHGVGCLNQLKGLSVCSSTLFSHLPPCSSIFHTWCLSLITFTFRSIDSSVS